MIEELKNTIFDVINKIDSSIFENQKNIKIEKIQNAELGDYSSNIFMVAKINENTRNLIINELNNNIYIQQNIKLIEYKEPGFLNFYLKDCFLINNLNKFVNLDTKLFYTNDVKSFLIEHTSPNTNKPLHIGHLRNNIFAMAIVRILKTLNHKVTTDCLFNDRGIHICKAMFGYLKFDGSDKTVSKVLDEWFLKQDKWPQPLEGEYKDSFVGKFYVLGVKLESDLKNKNEMQWLLQEWENGNEKVVKLWTILNNWFYEEFNNTFKVLDSYVDHYWYESKFFKQAKELAQIGFEKGIFVKLEDGALLTQLSSYGLTDDIVQRSDGTAMYFTQDLYLTKMKTEMFPSDEYIWVVGPEQKLHMKQIFAVCEQLGIGKIDQFKHLSYGAVCKKDGGKMSSRSGEVLSITDLISELKQVVLDKKENEYKSLNNFNIDEQEKIAEKIGLGAIKYAILKLEREQDLHFDLDEILDLKGNGSPYIQYTYTRCFSIIDKAREIQIKSEMKDINNEERILLRDLIYVKEILEKAGNSFSPNTIANYLFELARDFSNFYEKNRILDTEVNQKLRIDLTMAVANILKWGLELLGIEVMEKL